jgi:hypothetical protein
MRRPDTSLVIVFAVWLYSVRSLLKALEYRVCPAHREKSVQGNPHLARLVCALARDS